MAKIDFKKIPKIKYKLLEDVSIQTEIFPKKNILTKFISLTTQGVLTVFKNYCWDGASGPAIDTETFMRGSLFHDALYQLLRLKLLPKEFKWLADKVLKTVTLIDGMNPVRVIYSWLFVKLFGWIAL